MTRPVIGITAYREAARWGAWDVDAVLVPDAYVRAVEAAGALAVLIPPEAFARTGITASWRSPRSRPTATFRRWASAVACR